ncbi:hypothetical protein ACFWP3_39880 [Streptomyces sp. NPDC058525]|uniref:hypothetical protein n=1 Tax=Streptomyces sp. NPDC058525 TaxID=3346538 RepID=UPI0036554D2D
MPTSQVNAGEAITKMPCDFSPARMRCMLTAQLIADATEVLCGLGSYQGTGAEAALLAQAGHPDAGARWPMGSARTGSLRMCPMKPVTHSWR